MDWRVYIIHSFLLGKYYIGYTHELGKRLAQHASNFYGNTSFTAKADDWVLVLQLPCRDEKHARQVERHIKQMKSSAYVKNLVAYAEMQQKLLRRF